MTHNAEPLLPGASGSFGVIAHERFAEFSGDHNPMHMDALAARRTAAGAPVIHGLHTLSWSLDRIASELAQGMRISSVRARFNKFLYVGASASLASTKRSATRISAQITSGGDLICSLIVGLAPASSATVDRPPLAQENAKDLDLTVPADLSLEQLRDLKGFVRAASSEIHAGDLFPRLAAVIGTQAVCGLGCISRLVGMVCPGLHSVLAEVDLRFKAAETSPGIAFVVTATDQRYHRISQRISGSGLEGEIECFRRPAPVAQVSASEIRSRIVPNEFASSVALVIGASRGLGEVVAKAIGAGGGHVIATYSVGREDCERVAETVIEVGGKCDTLVFDARLEVERQLSNLPSLPKSVYYFATPPIFQPDGDLFTRARFDQFYAVYVQGFLEVCTFMQRSANASRINIFYPSSLAIDARPPGMTAYAMAKAAGEILCADLNRQLQGLRICVHRLPRVLTDQTASVVPVESASGVELMLPIVREMERYYNAVK